MFDEPENGKLRLVAVNDLPENKHITYTVKRFSNDKIVLSGKCEVPADAAVTVDFADLAENEKEFYYIEWTMDGKTYKNHYFTNIIDIDYQAYIQALEKYGMNEFEGFNA